MKDEIKEILDNFKIYEDRYKKCNETQFIIFYRDIHLLLDYITNLQEQLEIKSKGFKVTVEELCETSEKLEQLQEENQRLKKEIENLTHIVANKVIEDYDIDTPLKNQLNEERIKYINLGVVCNDYKSRCEKAVDEIQQLIDIGLNNFLPKLEEIQDKLANGGDEE